MKPQNSSLRSEVLTFDSPDSSRSQYFEIDALISEFLSQTDQQFLLQAEEMQTSQIPTSNQGHSGASLRSTNITLKSSLPPQTFRLIRVYIIGQDYPQLFTILCGLLAASSLEIVKGKLDTRISSNSQKFIVNQITGQLRTDTPVHLWLEKLRRELSLFYAMLKSQNPQIRERLVQKVLPSIRNHPQSEGVLDPIQLKIQQKTTSTEIRLESSDTPFFLFNLGLVLGLHNLNIEEVSIQTIDGRIIDTICCTNLDGTAVLDPEQLARIQLSILITKQFTGFLAGSPDPAKAVLRFAKLIHNQLDNSRNLLEFLASSQLHAELGLLLGSSDFLWEDFIRVQQDNIIPMLAPMSKSRKELLSTSPDLIDIALQNYLAECDSDHSSHSENSSIQSNKSTGEDFRVVNFDRCIQAVNDFKNQECFLIDIDHIMLRNRNFFFLSHRLSALADAVLRMACRIAWQIQTERYGVPRTDGGLEAKWAVFGLGKLGGRAIGYASDLEILCMFSDNGQSDGERSIRNRDFFEQFFLKARSFINAKKEGIFQIDLRLRPHGEGGPVAVKLDSFSNYYRQGGQAHSAERLALVRMRQIAGDKDFGENCLALRDFHIYESDSIKIPELRQLRRRQLREKLGTDTNRSSDTNKGDHRFNSNPIDQNAIHSKIINVKFNPGGLVDLEYNVQILQIIHGRKNKELRSPEIHKALKLLSQEGRINPNEAESMILAYRFHRNTINALRMLRGNANDLYLPAEDSEEFRHLARRMGYAPKGGLGEAQQLIIDFETHSAIVCRFVEEHLGRDAIPVSRSLGIVDIVLRLGRSREHANLDDKLPQEKKPETNETYHDLQNVELQNQEFQDEISQFFKNAGFIDHQKAKVNLAKINNLDSEKFLPLIILAWRQICQSADPDSALNNWEQFTKKLDLPGKHFDQLLSKPARIDILFKLFAGSQYLADILIQNPNFFLWSTDPETVTHARTQIEMEHSLRSQADTSTSRKDWQDSLRRIKKQELLRIGLRDIALGVKIETIMGEITFLARSCIEVALDQAVKLHTNEQKIDWRQNIVILAFGKLGGWELNYSSDIDLLCVYRSNSTLDRDTELQTYTSIFRMVVQDLNDFTQEGQAYRVDMRLRPFGNVGSLVSSYQSILDYYESSAKFWEFQALIKLKPVAGNLELGEELLEDLKPLFYASSSQSDPLVEIASMRERSIEHHTGQGYGQESGLKTLQGFDVKNDHGAIRDIEFYLQAQQMLYAQRHPSILRGNTLRCLHLLAQTRIISTKLAKNLSDNYRYLRRLEHYLQLLGNKQLHCLPESPDAMDKLLRCLHPEWSQERFVRHFKTTIAEVYNCYRSLFGDGEK